ncbi:hypothetical protein Droror1_Dr00006749 [Drosera rotundifolia]
MTMLVASNNGVGHEVCRFSSHRRDEHGVDGGVRLSVVAIEVVGFGSVRRGRNVEGLPVVRLRTGRAAQDKRNKKGKCWASRHHGLMGHVFSWAGYNSKKVSAHKAHGPFISSPFSAKASKTRNQKPQETSSTFPQPHHHDQLSSKPSNLEFTKTDSVLHTSQTLTLNMAKKATIVSSAYNGV